MHINFSYSSRWRISFLRDSKGTRLKFMKAIKLTIIVSLIGNATIAFRVPYGDSEWTKPHPPLSPKMERELVVYFTYNLVQKNLSCVLSLGSCVSFTPVPDSISIQKSNGHQRLPIHFLLHVQDVASYQKHSAVDYRFRQYNLKHH